jgi:hypothetical protein
MSQELVPISDSEGLQGLSPTLVTTVKPQRAIVLSPEFKDVKKLYVQPTEWVPGGRPIYRRLPANSETYQVDFFADGDIGYTFIPPGNDQFGAGSMYVEVSSDRRSLLIYDGVIVWKEGTNPVLKTIVDFEEIGLESGRFLVAYQQIYDDSPTPLPFQATDYSLAGLNFNVNDSASDNFLSTERPNGNAWPYPGAYAFAPSSAGVSWKNYLDPVNQTPQSTSGVIPGMPEIYQPVNTWLEWSSPLPWKLDTIVLRTPLEGSLPPASLYYKEEGDWKLIQTSNVSTDSSGNYWVFLTNNAAQLEWRVEWPQYSKVQVNDITVSGVLYVESRPSTAVTRSQLAIYPTNLVPETEKFCRLAIINVNDFEIQTNPRGELLVDDIRNIATRDYEPVADWLTEYWDESLVNIKEKTRTYAPGFMAPPTLLKSSYFDLEKYGVSVEAGTPPYPPNPPADTEVNLIGASVSLTPILPSKSELIGAEVSFLSPIDPPAIASITVNVTP